jgi:hypothetical protein
MTRAGLFWTAVVAVACAPVWAAEPSHWLSEPPDITYPVVAGDESVTTFDFFPVHDAKTAALWEQTRAMDGALSRGSVASAINTVAFDFEQEAAKVAKTAPDDGCHKSEWQHLGCVDDWCHPRVCRFDCPPDCGCGVTDQYCPHECAECYRGSLRKCDKCDGWVTDSWYGDVLDDQDVLPGPALRFGWWAVDSHGSETKTGEFQDLDSGPFWDIDMVRSDGVRTIDLILSGLDNEANNARAYYYGPGLSAKVRYERFLRRLDHDPLAGAPITGPLGPSDNVVTQDLNVGEDYAIRVHQLDAKFQGKLTDNIKWRLNVWGMRKFGERQANAPAHCFDVDPGPATNNVCHVLSQRQQIDWLTKEIQPVLEARFENVTIEYSRTMRELEQGDAVVDRRYTRFAPFAGPGNTLGSPFDYALVPENFTQIDRLKIGSDLTENNRLYANLYYGDTQNYFRDTHRRFSGFDVRLTNRSFDDLTLTGYANMDDQDNQFPPFLLPEETEASVRSQIRHPIDYTQTRAGLKGVWRPYGEDYSSSERWRSLEITSGYEYGFLAREFATYQTALGPFTQPDTTSHQIHIGPYWRWSPVLDSYVRYRVYFIDDPLIGVREANGRFNTNQPEQEHRVELGGTWNPAKYFMTTAQFSLVNRWHRSEFANFTEDNYPIILTAWYSPIERLSLTGGYGYFSNWINQDITLGYRFNVADQTETTRWDYAGESHLVSLNAAYAWTPQVQLTAGYEWVRGDNSFVVPPSPAGADWSLLPSFSDVVVETQRVTAGVDWQPYANTSVYFRYVLFDYDDIAANLDSGTANMFLAGMSLIR